MVHALARMDELVSASLPLLVAMMAVATSATPARERLTTLSVAQKLLAHRLAGLVTVAGKTSVALAPKH